jgi:hypothetical protein
VTNRLLRVLLQSAVNTNKNNGPGYVALARLEEIGGKLHAAKSVIRGTEIYNAAQLNSCADLIRWMPECAQERCRLGGGHPDQP